MKIRKYTDNDFEQMMQLHREVLQKENVYRGSGFWEEDLLHIEEYYFKNNGEFIVGMKNDKIVAMGALRKIDEKMAEIVRMRVHPDLQGNGFGKRILNELEQFAHSKNYTELILETDERLTKAISLYKKMDITFGRKKK